MLTDMCMSASTEQLMNYVGAATAMRILSFILQAADLQHDALPGGSRSACVLGPALVMCGVYLGATGSGLSDRCH